MGYFDSILQGATPATRDIMNAGYENYQQGANSARDARIAELEAELASIREQRKAFDDEAEMGKYKFLYDADPSTYTNYRQNMRSAEQTEKIRKATEDATKASELKSALNRNTLELENALIDQQAADAALGRVQGGSDTAAIEQAKFAKKRADTAVNRLQRERKELSDQMARRLGISVSDVETDEKKVVKNDEPKPAGSSSGEDAYYKERNDKVAEINGKLDQLDIDFTPNAKNKMEAGTKEPKVYEALRDLAIWRGWVEASDLGTSEKESLKTRIAKAEQTVRKFKDEQPEKLTPEQVKAAYQKEVDGKNPTQVKALGIDKIDKMLKAGVKWKFTTKDGRTITLESIAKDLRGGTISK